MSAVNHFAHYLTKASDTKLEELLAIQVRCSSRKFRDLVAASLFTRELRSMVQDEIDTREVSYPLDNESSHTVSSTHVE